jgi:hypothetical protein
VIVSVQGHASVVAMLKGAQGAPGALPVSAFLAFVSWKFRSEKCSVLKRHPKRHTLAHIQDD